jgi:hypothetical protein
MPNDEGLSQTLYEKVALVALSVSVTTLNSPRMDAQASGLEISTVSARLRRW